MEPEDRVGAHSQAELNGSVVTDTGGEDGQIRVGGRTDWGRRQDGWAGQIWGGKDGET